MPVPRVRRAQSTAGGAVGWALASYAIAGLGYLALNGFAGRLLGVDEFGTFVVLVTAATTIGQIGLLGIHRGGLRDAALMDLRDARHDSAVATLRAEARGVSWIALPVVALATGVTTLIVGGAGDVESLFFAIAMASLVLLGGEQKLRANLLRGFGRARTASLIEGGAGGTVVVLLQALGVGLLLAAEPAAGLLAALAVMVAGYAVPVAAGHGLLHGIWRRNVPVTPPWLALRSASGRHWRFGAAQVATFAGPNVEIWVAGLVLLAADVSRFAAAQRVAVLLLLPLTPLQLALAPAIARLVAGGQREELALLVRTAAAIATGLAGLAFVGLLLASDRIVTAVFGGTFGSSGALLVVLACGALVNVSTGLCGTVLAMADRAGTVAAFMWGSLLLRVGLGVPVATIAGVEGLAILNALVTAVTWLGLLYAARRQLGVWTSPTLRPALAAFRRVRG